MRYYNNEIVIEGTYVLCDSYSVPQKVVLHIPIEDIVEAIKQVQERIQEESDKENEDES